MDATDRYSRTGDDDFKWGGMNGDTKIQEREDDRCAGIAMKE